VYIDEQYQVQDVQKGKVHIHTSLQKVQMLCSSHMTDAQILINYYMRMKIKTFKVK